MITDGRLRSFAIMEAASSRHSVTEPLGAVVRRLRPEPDIGQLIHDVQPELVARVEERPRERVVGAADRVVTGLLEQVGRGAARRRRRWPRRAARCRGAPQCRAAAPVRPLMRSPCAHRPPRCAGRCGSAVRRPCPRRRRGGRARRTGAGVRLTTGCAARDRDLDGGGGIRHSAFRRATGWPSSSNSTTTVASEGHHAIERGLSPRRSRRYGRRRCGRFG